MKRSADISPDDLVRFVRGYEEAVAGSAWCTREDILLVTEHPGHDPLRDGWCVTRPQGGVVAWATLTTRGGPSLDCTLAVLPDVGDSVAHELLTRLLARADELPRHRGGGHETVISGVLNGDPVVPRIIRKAGFTRQNTYTRCEVDLSRASLPAAPPDGGLVRPVGCSTDDARVLHDIHTRTRITGARTLAHETFRARLEQFGAAARRRTGVSLLCEIAGTPVGYVLARAGGPRARIVDMAVSPAFRGRGVGLALLAAALDRLRHLGCSRAQLALDSSRLAHQRVLYEALAVTREVAVTQYARRLP